MLRCAMHRRALLLFCAVLAVRCHAMPCRAVPCFAVQSRENANSCSATALDASTGADLSHAISVVDVTPCGDGAAGPAASALSTCLRCTPDMVAEGACLQGSYVWQYVVPGASANATLQVRDKGLGETKAWATQRPVRDRGVGEAGGRLLSSSSSVHATYIRPASIHV